jgi:hypothetical protein
MPQDFEVDTSDYLGFKYDAYIHEMQTLAISQPSEYNNIRTKVVKELKEQLLESAFNLYYHLLTDGKGFSVKSPPSYPKQKASKFALKATNVMNEILDEALAIVLPSKQADFAQLQQSLKATAAGIDK